MAARTLLISLFAAWTISATVSASENVYRWVDDNGQVQYTRSLPAEAAHKPYDLIAPSGIVIKRVTEPELVGRPVVDTGPEPLHTEEEKRQISDRLLMLRYHSEEELVAAMQLEIDNLKYDLHLLESTRASVWSSLNGQVSKAANQQRAGQQVSEAQLQEINRLRRRLETNRIAKLTLDNREKLIRERFDGEIERYRKLVAEVNGDT